MVTLISVMFLMFAPQATILHRAPVEYPRAAMLKGVQGTVVVEVDVDAAGLVTDARVVSGPAELRNAALRSVLDWHFSKQIGLPAVTQVSVDFELPKDPAPSAKLASPIKIEGGLVDHINVAGLTEAGRATLLAGLPVHEGDELNADLYARVTQAVESFDEHLHVTLIRQASHVTIDIAPRGAQTAAAFAGSAPRRIRVGGNVQQAMLVDQVRPVYPPQAKAAGIQGTVRLNAVIGTDGHIQNLEVVSGDPALVPVAMEAVRQWVYKPTLLNGAPVEVATTIDVNFTLSQ